MPDDDIKILKDDMSKTIVTSIEKKKGYPIMVTCMIYKLKSIIIM